MAGQKTEKATTKKRETQRKEGNVAQSRDIVGAVLLICVFELLKSFGWQYFSYMGNTMKFFLGSLNANISGGGDMQQRYMIVLTTSAEVVVPIIILSVGISIVATMAQTRMLFTPQNAKFNLEKLNPISGIKNLFSPRAMIEIVKSIIKIIVIGIIMFMEIQGQLQYIVTIYNQSVIDSVSFIANFAIDVCLKGSIAFLVIGIGDYFFQLWDFERRIKMSKEEIKEEYKQTEGNPETKGRMRNEQRRLARLRQIQAVPTADVVIRNPTHYAVALKYDKDKSKAPIVVAKGQNNVALKIVEVATASRVHVIENKPLAQALYKTVEVGDEIPSEFYKAVAEVLAFIFKLKRAGRS